MCKFPNGSTIVYDLFNIYIFIFIVKRIFLYYSESNFICISIFLFSAIYVILYFLFYILWKSIFPNGYLNFSVLVLLFLLCKVKKKSRRRRKKKHLPSPDGLKIIVILNFCWYYSLFVCWYFERVLYGLFMVIYDGIPFKCSFSRIFIHYFFLLMGQHSPRPKFNRSTIGKFFFYIFLSIGWQT